MRFVVFVKQVPDTMDMSVDEEGSLIRSGVPSVLNPYCELALRRVVELKSPGDSVVAVTMGPPSASECLRRCLYLGADEAFLLTDQAFAGADVYATARVLTAFVTRHVPDADLLVFGRQAIDGDTGQVPAEVAAMLGVQQSCYVTSLSKDGCGFIVDQDYGDSIRRCHVPCGSVVSFSDVDPNGILPTISDVMDGMSRGMTSLGRVDLGLGLYSVGLKGSRTRIVSTRTQSSVRRNRKVEIRDPATAADFIIKEMEAI